MGHSLTKVSRDGQWKVDMRAFKNYMFFYASIGTDVTVYHRERTDNIWGQATTDWVERAAAISISNTYKGSLGSGGLGTFVQSGSFQGSTAELKVWATGFFKIDIPSGSPGVGGAQLNVDSVTGAVSVGVGNEIITGEVTASSIISDPFWG